MDFVRKLNPKIIMSLVLISMLLIPASAGFAQSDQYMKTKDNTSKNLNMEPKISLEDHMQWTTEIPDAHSFSIEDTKITTKHGTITISGHGMYNPEIEEISAWGEYSISLGSRQISGTWSAANLVSGSGNPFGGDSSDSAIHFVGKTVSLKDPKFTGSNAKRESPMRGSHQIWIFADSEDGKLCVYGTYVGSPSLKDACMETDTISINR